jgi:N-ethylmaleimide reductase
MYKHLLSPVQAGSIELTNRAIMAPLTRSRAGRPGDVPTDMNVEYYAQRAGAGLIVSEGTQVSQQGQGYAWTPGIYTDEQEAGWKQVTEAVHAKGGRIAAQLWHVGRLSHPLLQDDGAAPVAPSAIIAATTKCFVVQPDGTAGNVDTVVPRALGTEEIAGVIAQYSQAAARARRAGFDFVEIHAANGYLPHQFLATGTNQRTDAYGGSIENRARFVLEAVDAAIAEMGAERVGVRLSPHFAGHNMVDDEADASTLYVAKELTRRGVAYLHIAEPDWVGGAELTDQFRRQIRAEFSGLLIFCGGYSAAEADALIANGIGDAVGFGRPFLANPDLVERFRAGAELNVPDQTTFYGGDARGYIDYPTLKQAA